jgi:galactokinase
MTRIVTRRNAVEAFRASVVEQCQLATRIAPAVYVSEAGDGACEVAGGEVESGRE